MNAFNLECFIGKPIWFKSENLSCMDFILTNKKELFKHSEIIQLKISDHLGFVATFIKSQLAKGNAKAASFLCSDNQHHLFS